MEEVAGLRCLTQPSPRRMAPLRAVPPVFGKQNLPARRVELLNMGDQVQTPVPCRRTPLRSQWDYIHLSRAAHTLIALGGDHLVRPG